MALLAFQPPKLQQRIRIGVIVALIVLLVGRMMLAWVGGMIIDFRLDLPEQEEREDQREGAQAAGRLVDEVGRQ